MASNQAIDMLREMLRAALKSQESSGKRELLHMLASVVQEELIADQKKISPYSADMELIMRAVIFTLWPGHLYQGTMECHEVEYLRHNLLSGSEQLLQHAQGVGM